jgi:4'-phosphopantetheinyl transferase EntD
MIERLVPATVTTVATSVELDAGLFDEEAISLGRAVAARRREFRTGRACAREALARLGLADVAIPSGARGEPLWPASVVGSITHCAGYRAAAVARASDVRGLGIDAEPHAPLPDGVLDAVSSAAERRALGGAGVCWDRLLFSAKEAVFKAWFPLAGRGLEFCDVEVAFDDDGTFTARVLVDGPLRDVRGRWAVDDGLACTAVVAA